MLELNERRFGHESIRSFEDGQIIFLEGDESWEMYVVQEGEIEVIKKSC